MINKFKSFNLFEKIFLIILSVLYFVIIVKGIMLDETRVYTLSVVFWFLILILWLFSYNQFISLKKWFDINKFRIMITMITVLIFCYFTDLIFISEYFTRAFVNLTLCFLIGSFMSELHSKNIIDNSDAIICMFSFYFCFNYKLFNPIFVIILFSYSTYIISGLIIDSLKKIKKDTSLIIDILGIAISFISLVISIII